ncbi:MAG: hypothetical protein CMA83_01260 [Euryarchaeota archaeon]|jgi:hypothetical protein|nr:hypothetical protein [Euryarchaeota archaeon]|tara:strand:+ start:303 stop:1058 length:756 start_codon:yes stop_codon:yes gene_type:complete
MAGIISQEHADRLNRGDTSRYSRSTSSGNNTSGSSSSNTLSGAFGSDQGHQVRREDQWGAVPDDAIKVRTSITRKDFNNPFLGTSQRKNMGARASQQWEDFNPISAKEAGQKSGLSFDVGSALRSTAPAQAQAITSIDDIMAGSYEEGILKSKMHELKMAGMQSEEAVSLVTELMKQGQLGHEVANAIKQLEAGLIAADITGRANLTNQLLGGMGNIFGGMFQSINPFSGMGGLGSFGSLGSLGSLQSAFG